MKWLTIPALLARTVAVAQPSEPDHSLPASGVDLVEVLPPAPERGTPRYDADRRTFRESRKLVATPRGAQATGDVREDVPTMLEDFSPAAGRTLTPDSNPILAALLRRMRPDVEAAVNPAKSNWHRQRPFLIDRGPICQPTDNDTSEQADSSRRIAATFE